MFDERCFIQPFSFPEPPLPLTSGRKTRALGATISGMRHRCRLRRETGWEEFGYILCYFRMVAPRALVFRPLVKGNEDSGNEIDGQPYHIKRVWCTHAYHACSAASIQRFHLLFTYVARSVF